MDLFGVASSREVANSSHYVSVKGTRDKKRKEIDEERIKFIIYSLSTIITDYSSQAT